MNLVVSAAGTGAGKTLVARALCVAFRAAGRTVQPYKVGPDYIDARLYAPLCGRPAYNVDLWLDGVEGARRHVAATAAGADVAVFEGMMGLFDGDDAGTTSTAALARALDARVVLVLDGWTASQTLGAVALGLRQYDPELRIAGAIVNRCGGGAHEAAVRAACARAGVPVLCAIANDPALAIPERRLGLDPDAAARAQDAVVRLGHRLRDALDLDELAPRAAAAPALAPSATAPGRGVRIAVAEDDAFWFTYPETLEALRAAGAQIVTFSPLADRALPDGIDGLWLSGGYPELHAATLAGNEPMRRAVRGAVEAGVPTYAECGGHMYLAEWLDTGDGRFPMAGALAGGSSMANARLTIGYRTARVAADTPLDPAGATVRGYAFHYAVGAMTEECPAYRFEDGSVDGVAQRALVSSFLHRHFIPGDPAIARFVRTCEARA